MVRKIIVTDQEKIWSDKTGLAISDTNEAVKVRNISLTDIQNINDDFVQKEKSDIEFIQTKFKFDEWIPYFSFAMNRKLNEKERINLVLSQITKNGKYATFYGEEINQSHLDFIKQYESCELLCKNKELLPVLDPAEINHENLANKIKYLVERGKNKIVLQYRDIFKYIRCWEAIRLASSNNLLWIVVDVKPKKTNDSYKYSNLIAPFFFSENVLVCHGRGRGFGTYPTTWLNEHLSYKQNKKLEKLTSKSKLSNYSGVYNINKAIKIASNKLQVSDLTKLTDIDGITHFAKQLASLNVR